LEIRILCHDEPLSESFKTPGRHETPRVQYFASDRGGATPQPAPTTSSARENSSIAMLYS
jgi:hypothetical protein